jgi:hypothetical protein
LDVSVILIQWKRTTKFFYIWLDEFESRICLLFSFRTIAILIVLSGIFLVISSNFIMYHEGGVLAKPGKDNPGKGHGKIRI